MCRQCCPGKVLQGDCVWVEVIGGWERTWAEEEPHGSLELCCHVMILQHITLPSLKIDITVWLVCKRDSTMPFENFSQKFIEVLLEMEWIKFHRFFFSEIFLSNWSYKSLQYFCLENPRDRGAWWAAVYAVTQSQAWLKRLSSSSSSNRRSYKTWGTFSLLIVNVERDNKCSTSTKQYII